MKFLLTFNHKVRSKSDCKLKIRFSTYKAPFTYIFYANRISHPQLRFLIFGIPIILTFQLDPPKFYQKLAENVHFLISWVISFRYPQNWNMINLVCVHITFISALQSFLVAQYRIVIQTIFFFPKSHFTCKKMSTKKQHQEDYF